MARRSTGCVLAVLVVLVAVLGSTGAPAATRFPFFRATVFHRGGGEPNVSISPSGKVVLVDGLGDESPATLYRSTDYGRTFHKLSPTFPIAGGGDWDMRFIDDRHVIAADLDLGLDGGIHIHRSADAGQTWKTTTILTDIYDRPWLDHFGRDMVYVVAKGFDGLPYLYISKDGGVSFGSPPVPILVYGTGVGAGAAGGDSPNPVESFVTNQDAYIDHITVDPRSGDVYVLYGIGGENSYPGHPPFGVANRLYVAHLETTPAGTPIMVSHAVHVGGADETFISGFNWSAVDAAGTLYVLGNGAAAGHHSARLSYSKDKGKTWSPLFDLAPSGAANVYGSIAAGAPGVLSLVYLRGSLEDPSKDQNWFVEMSRITGADTARPVVYRTRPIRSAIHTKDICFDGILCGTPGFGNNRALLDYIWNAIAPDGTAYAAIASDGPATGGGGVSTVLLRQSGGASHGRGAPS